MAVKLTDLGILIYVVMALYLAAAVAFARRRQAAATVVVVLALAATALAVLFRFLSMTEPTYQTPYEVLFAVGSILYAALGLGLAAGWLVKRERLAGTVLFVAGFGVAVAGFVLRWVEVKHAPLQNMFEVFLCLGMLMWPISLFCRRMLGVGGEAADAIIGVIILFPAGFIFKAEPQHLPPALQSFLFIPHVAAYMLSYVILAKATVPAAQGLFRRRPLDDLAALDYETAANRIARLGFPLLTLGLVLGMWWGKRAWGDYWNWDPKELWSFISWLVYLAYFHFRYMFGLRFKRANCAFLVAGLVAIFLTLIWVNLAPIFSGGMHSYAS
jgi:ABC-type transport system involved in cytochrome c biogenesis permease subunit